MPFFQIDYDDPKLCYKYMLMEFQYDECLQNLNNSYCSSHKAMVVKPQHEPLQVSMLTWQRTLPKSFQFQISYAGVTCPELEERIGSKLAK